MSRTPLLSLTPTTERGALVLELFGAKRFIPAQNEDYNKIEAVGVDWARSADGGAGAPPAGLTGRLHPIDLTIRLGEATVLLGRSGRQIQPDRPLQRQPAAR